MAQRPSLVSSPQRGAISAAVLIAHGGRELGTAAPGRYSLAALRMAPFATALRRAPSARGLLIAQLRYRVRGYNDGDPVSDVVWGIDTISREHGVPIVLVGHSMGARAALRAAGHSSVLAVAGLSPWCPPGEPVEQLADRSVMLVQGLADRWTLPAASRAYALRARGVTQNLCRFEIAGSKHAMLQRARLWHQITRDFVLGVLGLGSLDERIADAFTLPSDRAVAVRL
ncbi:MAG: alpha/beta fold hydrolase [Candidatus Dormibacteria bacterium]